MTELSTLTPTATSTTVTTSQTGWMVTTLMRARNYRWYVEEQQQQHRGNRRHQQPTLSTLAYAMLWCGRTRTFSPPSLVTRQMTRLQCTRTLWASFRYCTWCIVQYHNHRTQL